MSTVQTTSDHLLLFRGMVLNKGLSPAELEKVMEDWKAWFEGLLQDGRCTGGHPLHPQGKLVSGKNGRTVTDGPFTESKEAIGGYFYLKVAGMDEALEIAKQCPGLEYGIVVEVRPVADQCSLRARALEQARRREHAGAIA